MGQHGMKGMHVGRRCVRVTSCAGGPAPPGERTPRAECCAALLEGSAAGQKWAEDGMGSGMRTGGARIRPCGGKVQLQNHTLASCC